MRKGSFFWVVGTILIAHGALAETTTASTGEVTMMGGDPLNLVSNIGGPANLSTANQDRLKQLQSEQATLSSQIKSNSDQLAQAQPGSAESVDLQNKITADQQKYHENQQTMNSFNTSGIWNGAGMMGDAKPVDTSASLKSITSDAQNRLKSLQADQAQLAKKIKSNRAKLAKLQADSSDAVIAKSLIDADTDTFKQNLAAIKALQGQSKSANHDPAADDVARIEDAMGSVSNAGTPPGNNQLAVNTNSAKNVGATNGLLDPLSNSGPGNNGNGNQ